MTGVPLGSQRLKDLPVSPRSVLCLDPEEETKMAGSPLVLQPGQPGHCALVIEARQAGEVGIELYYLIEG